MRGREYNRVAMKYGIGWLGTTRDSPSRDVATLVLVQDHGRDIYQHRKWRRGMIKVFQKLLPSK